MTNYRYLSGGLNVLTYRQIMVPLARRNLLHDKIRLCVTLAGVVTAIVLMSVQVGLFLGFTRMTSGVIDHSNADLWIGAKGVPYFDAGSVILEKTLYQVRSDPDVAEAEKLLVRFTGWKLPHGGEEVIELVGLNPDSALGRPWNIVAGAVTDLKLEDTVLVDEVYRSRLGVTKIGHVGEISGRRARVAGFTSGIRSFTTSPLVFTSFSSGLEYLKLGSNDTIYILVKGRVGVMPLNLKGSLSSRLPDVDVFTREEYSQKTRLYWMFTTGAGIALLVAGMMGLVVGTVVVAQTLYATTMDHIREFGTLKAIGASNGFIYRVILKQAIWSAVLGYSIGAPLALLIGHESTRRGAAILLPWQFMASLFIAVVLMCSTAAVLSINKVTRLDPAVVFKA